MAIQFSYDGVAYTVSYDAYKESGLIRLPDGRVLWVGSWLESYPPQPSKIEIASVESFPGQPVFEVK